VISLDDVIARPYKVEGLPDESNPWLRKWSRSSRLPRRRWPWRIRVEIWWFLRMYTIGLLFWNVRKMRSVDVVEPGFGVHFYLDDEGWIEGLAT
jgi:hypothetical protein